MPFTTIQQPTTVAPVRSPVRLVLKDMEYLQMPGAMCRWSIAFMGPSSPGDTITIRYADISLTFTAAATPLDNGLSYSTAPTSVAVASAFEMGAKKNYFLVRDFTITRSSNTVTFQARHFGTEYQPSIVTATGSATAHLSILVGGADRVYRARHHVGLAVSIENEYGSDNWERMPDQAGHPDSDSIVEFDISKWLKPWLRPDDVPYNLVEPMLAVQSMKRFYVQYWSRYETLPVAQPQKAVYTGPIVRAWLAGHPRADKSVWNSWYQTLVNAPSPFLTSRGRTVPREVTRAELHALTWHTGYSNIVTPGTHYLILQASVQFNTGQSTGHFDVLSVPATFPYYHNLIWPSGWNQLGMDAILTDLGHDPNNAVAYSLRIRATMTQTIVSEEYRFDLVMPDYQDVHLQFFNSMGAWESVRFSGQWERTAKPGYTELAQPLGYKDDNNSMAAGHGSVHTGTQDSLKLYSAVNPMVEHTALLDMLNSPAIRMVDTTRGRFLPLRIVESEEVPVQTRGTEQEHLNQLMLTVLVDDPQPVRNILP